MIVLEATFTLEQVQKFLRWVAQNAEILKPLLIEELFLTEEQIEHIRRDGNVKNFDQWEWPWLHDVTFSWKEGDYFKIGVRLSPPIIKPDGGSYLFWCSERPIPPRRLTPLLEALGFNV